MKIIFGTTNERKKEDLQNIILKSDVLQSYPSKQY